MRDALRAEIFKTVNRRMTYILLGAIVALMTLFYVILWLRLREGPETGVQAQVRYLALREGMSFVNVLPYGLQLERFFLTLIAVIFTATMMGNEYDWRTVGVVMSRGVRRRDFVAAKLVTSAVFLLAALCVGFVVAMIWSAWFSNLYGLPYGTFGVARFADLFASLGRTWFVIMPFVLMALLFSTFWRSAGQAVGFALGFFFLEGIFTGLLDSAHGFLAHIPDALMNANVTAVMRANGVLSSDSQDRGPFATSQGGVGIWQGALVLLAYIAAFGMAAFWRFQKRDIQE
jgi:ABC-type transport system involved in multi-copper enzyme maturation permease subunit